MCSRSIATTLEPNIMQDAIVQALPVQPQSKQRKQSSQTPPSSHCTRSQVAPDWTMQEVLVLLSEIAAIDEDWLEELSSYQRWKMVSDSCLAMNVVRSSNQCKRKWEMLLGDYRKIRLWESRSRDNSYWFLLEDRKKDFGLPVSFPKEVFEAMDAVLQVQKHLSDSENSDPDQFETSYVDADSEEELVTTSDSLEMEELITTTKSQEVEELVTTTKSLEGDESKGPEKACAMADDELIPPVKNLEAKEPIITSKSPNVEELITASGRPDNGHAKTEEGLITNSKCPEMEELITLQSQKAGDLFTTSSSPKVEVLVTASKSSQKASAMAGKLQEYAEHVCAVLRGELQDGVSPYLSASLESPKPTAAQTEFARRRADELIKALARLTSSLDELGELIGNGGECAGIKPVNSMA